MPPPPSRNYFVIMFDLKVENKNQAYNTLFNILLYKRAMKSRDERKLFVVNSGQNEAAVGVASVVTGGKIEKVFQTISDFPLGDSKLYEVMAVGIKELKMLHKKPGIETLQLVLITDLKSFKYEANDLQKKIIHSLKKYDIFLYVIGLNEEPLKSCFKRKDIWKWMADLEITPEEDNFNIIKCIVKATPRSLICSYGLGAHLFMKLTHKKRRQPWYVPLTFGTKLELPCKTLKLTLERGPFKLKWRRYRKDRLMVFKNQQNVQVPFGQVIKGIVRHKRFVRYYPGDTRFKVYGPRTFSVIGFVDADALPEYSISAVEAHVTQPSPKGSKNYKKFFYYLLKTMIDMKKYIIAKKLYFANVRRKYVVLVPRLDKHRRGFIVSQLPYAQAIAALYNEKSEATQTTEVSDEVTRFLDSLDLNKDTCKLKVQLTPGMTINPKCLAILKKVQEKKFNFHTPELHTYYKYSDDLVDLEGLKSAWPSRQLPVMPKCSKQPDTEFDNIADFNFD